MLLVKFAKITCIQKISDLQYQNFCRTLMTNCFLVFDTMPHRVCVLCR